MRYSLKRWLAATLLAGLAAPGASAAGELLRVYGEAQDNDASFSAARYTREAAVEARPQALAGLLPQLSASATQSWQRQRISGEGLADASYSSSHPYSYGLNLSQPLFDWAAFRRYAQAGDRVALAEAQFRAAEQDLMLRTAQAYFNLLAAADDLRSLQAQNNASQRQREEAQRRFEVGLAAVTDVQEAQASYDLTTAQLIASRQSLEAAKQALREITGQPVERWVALQDEIPLPTPSQDAETWVQAALQGNFDLMMADYQAGIAEADIGIARAGHYPTVNLAAARSTRQVNDFNQGKADADAVSLQLSLPLFAGGGVASQLRQAQATQRQYEAQALARKRLVERNTRDAWQGVVTGAAKVKAYRQAVVSNTTALEASETGFSVGTRTTIDVLNSRQLLYSAQRDYSRSRYDYLMSYLNLKAYAGQLATADLTLIDGLLQR